MHPGLSELAVPQSSLQNAWAEGGGGEIYGRAGKLWEPHGLAINMERHDTVMVHSCLTCASRDREDVDNL